MHKWYKIKPMSLISDILAIFNNRATRKKSKLEIEKLQNELRRITLASPEEIEQLDPKVRVLLKKIHEDEQWSLVRFRSYYSNPGLADDKYLAQVWADVNAAMERIHGKRPATKGRDKALQAQSRAVAQKVKQAKVRSTSESQGIRRGRGSGPRGS